MKKLLFFFSLLLHDLITPSAFNVPAWNKIEHAQLQVNATTKFIIGGTISVSDVSIGIFHVESNKPTLILEYQKQTKQIPNLALFLKEILTDLTQHHSITIAAACFAIPGTIKADGTFIHPHLPWNTSNNTAMHNDGSQKGIKKQDLVTATQLQNIYFLNDFQAIALGTQALDPSQLTILQQGNNKDKATKLIVGAGNGLGSSLLIWNETLQQYIPAPLNYSFTEFGAQNDLEFKFFKYLKDRTGNIAWGKVLGTVGGIKLIYEFFNTQRKYRRNPYVNYENYSRLS